MQIEDRTLYDLTYDLILKIGIDGRISAANLPACKALGYERSELVGESLRDLLSPNSREDYQSCLDTAMGDVPVQGSHLTLVNSEGRPLEVEAQFHKRATANGWSIYGVFHSLTEEQQVRRALRESEKRLRTVLAAVPDVLLVLDHRGQYRQIYTASEEMLVAPVEELLGRTLSDVLPRDEAELGMEALRAVIETQQPVHLEYKMGLGGIPKWFSARVVPFGTERDPCVLWVARDISSLMQARQKVWEDQQLLRSLLELETKAREIVAYEIHDGFVQYAVGSQLWLQNVMDEMHRLPKNAAQAMGVAVDSLNRAVEDARSMIRDLRPVIVDEQGVASGLHQLIEIVRQKTELPIEYRCEFVPPPMLQLLEGQVLRIVQESLNNAIRHSGASLATVRLTGNDAEILVDVTDDGRGFDPDKVALDRYGLEGIQQRARVFGGLAQVKSRPGSGTQISVRLPFIRRPTRVDPHLPIPGKLERGF